MNSKEALQTLKINNADNKIVMELLSVIEKDLEVLELLKSHLLFGYNGKAYGFQFYGINEDVAIKLAKWSCRNSHDLLEANTIKIKRK